MNRLIRDISGHLANGQPLVLATVIEQGGSAPRGAGAMMAVLPGAAILGTVGGGLLEAKVMEAAAALLGEAPGRAAFMDFDLTNELAAKSDMICGGRVRLFLEHAAPGGPASKALAAAADLLAHGKAVALCRELENEPLRAAGHRAAPLGQAPGAGGPLPEAWARALDAARATRAPALAEAAGRTVLAEPLFPAQALYILGAGHVSQPTAVMAAMAGFRTVVLDDRAEFANRERFPEADEVAVLDSFESAFAGREPDAESFIVIVTRGHLHDRTVLAQALRSPARYVGMIGSRRKRDAIYESLLADGFSQADIDRCHCPIGLAIGAQTPEEIAVSIVAELIQCRAGAGA